jgi:hypothetical protein
LRDELAQIGMQPMHMLGAHPFRQIALAPVEVQRL